MSPTLTYGIDFGTSNSAVAIRTGTTATLLDIPGSSKGILKSVIFFPDNSNTAFVGEEAEHEYVNCGMHGRLIQSIKSVLPDRSFTHTTINGCLYRAEDLVAVILRELKTRADTLVGHDVKRVVLGRPAHFSQNTSEDTEAHSRLVSAARIAGFDDVRLQLEPIAAAFSYESSIDQPQRVFVADLGAGTSDFAVVRLAPDRRSSADRRCDILGTGGVHVAGDDLDAAIMWHKLLPHFGYGGSYVSWGKRLPLPAHIFTMLCAWERMPMLREDRRLYTFIKDARMTTDRPDEMDNLIELIESNVGYWLFRQIERAKIELSHHEHASLDFHSGCLEVAMTIQRPEFVRYISEHVQAIRTESERTLQSAGVSAPQIDAAYITGGTSLVPAVRAVFAGIFGAEKIRERGTFSSVAEGLALACV